MHVLERPADRQSPPSFESMEMALNTFALCDQDVFERLQAGLPVTKPLVDAAYRRIIRQFHPDRVPGPDALALIQRVNAAMDVLRRAFRASKTPIGRS